MKVVTTTVGRKGPDYNDYKRQNSKRLEAARRALAGAIELGADVIVLPAGFFTAHSPQAREDIASSLLKEAKQLGIAIVFGVDQKEKNPRTDWEILSKGLLLPYYGYAWSPSENIQHLWQQRSSTSDNQWFVSEARCKEKRLLGIKDETIGVLMCGEIFNQRIRDALPKHRPRPKVVVDVAHVGQGFRVWQGMKALAALGLASVCSVHVQREYAMKYCYHLPGKRLSSRIPDYYVYGPPRIELKLWIF